MPIIFATVPISACGDLTTANTAYELTNSVYSNGTCFNINNTNITLLCAGYAITGNTSGYGINNVNYNRLTVQECTIQGFEGGIYLERANNSVIRQNVLQLNNLGLYSINSRINTLDNVSSINNNYGASFTNEYDTLIYYSAFNSNIYDGIYMQNFTFGDCRYNDFEWNNKGLVINGSNNNQFLNSTFSNNDDNGFQSSGEDMDTISYNSFDSNGWQGIESTGGSTGNMISYNHVYDNSYDGIHVNNLAIINNNDVQSNHHNGIYNENDNYTISNNIVNDNHNIGIFASSYGLKNSPMYGNHITNNWVYGLEIALSGLVYDNLFNNSVNIHWVGGLGGSSCNVGYLHFYTALDCNGTANILGALCKGGNAYYNISGKGYSDNATKCAGNSSGICTNAITYTTTCTYTGNPMYASDLLPLADVLGSTVYINVNIASPANNSNYSLTNIVLLNFSINASISNATCLYFTDGNIANFTIYGTVLNNTWHQVNLTFGNGIHNISVGCMYNAIYGLSNATNLNVNQYVNIINFTSPANNTLYTSQPNLKFDINSSFASVNCAGYITEPYLWYFNAVNGTYNVSFNSIHNISDGTYDIAISCWNGTINSGNISNVNFSLNSSPLFSTLIGVYLNSPADQTVFYTNDIPVNYTFQSVNFSWAYCCPMLDNNTFCLGLNKTVNTSTLDTMLNISNGTHQVSAKCYNGLYYNQSEKRTIYVNPTGIILYSPANNTPICMNSTILNFTYSSPNFTSANCSWNVDYASSTIFTNHSNATFTSLNASSLPTGLHNISVFCINGSWYNQSNIIAMDIEPNCIQIITPKSGAVLCDNTSALVSIKYQSQLVPYAECGARMDSQNSSTLIILNNILKLIGKGFLSTVYPNTTSTVTTYLNITNGTHNISVFCYHGGWILESGNITIITNSKNCPIINLVNASTQFLDLGILKFLIGLITIAICMFIGWKLANSMGAMIVMITVLIILSVIPNPPFIPIWIAILGILAGVLGITYQAKQEVS